MASNTSHVSQENPGMTRVVQKSKRYLKEEWDTLLWIISSFAIMYLFEVASNVLLNPRVKRSWQFVSLLSTVIAIGCIVKLVRRAPRLKLVDWDSSWTPTVGFISGLMAIVSFTVSMWPVWRYWTLLIVSVLYMGFISAVSLL